MGASLLESGRTGVLHPAVTNFAAMATAYRQQKPDSFNRAVADYREWLAPQFQKALKKGTGRVLFQQRQALPARDDHLHLRLRPGVRRRC